jgi:BlaI family transcriptional regulator, penicillinase repressor
MTLWQDLSRRERQIMDVLYARGEATVSEVLGDMPDPPSYSAVRAMLRKLEEKGHLTHDAMGPRYVYRPVVPHEAAQESALDRVMRTFFEGSASRTVQAILDSGSAELSEVELDALAGMIEKARRRSQ